MHHNFLSFLKHCILVLIVINYDSYCCYYYIVIIIFLGGGGGGTCISLKLIADIHVTYISLKLETSRFFMLGVDVPTCKGASDMICKFWSVVKVIGALFILFHSYIVVSYLMIM